MLDVTGLAHRRVVRDAAGVRAGGRCFVPAGGDGLPARLQRRRPPPHRDRAADRGPRSVGAARCRWRSRGGARARRVRCVDLAGRHVRDLDHAYGFGERAYEAVSAVLLDDAGRVLARGHAPQRRAPQGRPG
ncbi:hypothetical protein QJS66_11360 [Kocuria rhizophila]|nr:hypothetical protein QJS66_11360 [Kocuria rhizophila]